MVKQLIRTKYSNSIPCLHVIFSHISTWLLVSSAAMLACLKHSYPLFCPGLWVAETITIQRRLWSFSTDCISLSRQTFYHHQLVPRLIEDCIGTDPQMLCACALVSILSCSTNC